MGGLPDRHLILFPVAQETREMQRLTTANFFPVIGAKSNDCLDFGLGSKASPCATDGCASTSAVRCWQPNSRGTAVCSDGPLAALQHKGSKHAASEAGGQRFRLLNW